MKLPLSFLLLCAVAPGSEPITRPQLDAAIEKTRHESTRLEGLAQLIRMAGPRLYEGSLIFGDADPELFRLRGEAAKAAGACADIATVGKALDSPDREVRLWAVLSFDTRHEYTEAWRPLLPKLAKMLSDPDSGVRRHAVERLRDLPGGAAAIAAHAPAETDPEVLMTIAGSGTSPDLYRWLVRLLSSQDAKVREAALTFVYGNLWNPSTAAMWKLGFNQELYERVQALARSPSPGEKENARRALEQLDRLKQGADR